MCLLPHIFNWIQVILNNKQEHVFVCLPTRGVVILYYKLPTTETSWQYGSSGLTLNTQAASVQTCTMRVREYEKHHIWRSLLKTSTTRMTFWPLGCTERQTGSESTQFGAKDDWTFSACLHDSSCWAEKKTPKARHAALTISPHLVSLNFVLMTTISQSASKE